ncbi:Uu.00g076650.m01.CDS01 [Anthostomella pinea]|uniref:Uu.00g076650.m01.CDS01 n=1 Tax=Anthostomella pinea TaxID=933095 RepID=A0AAI8VWH2_9PEZI|nr:Uu.00g076650.m01.CDS01 [Anthostomella pinea]
MAPVVTAVPLPVPKIKRPPPPGIQTNGASSIQSSPSPSVSTKKHPTAIAKQQQGSGPSGVNGTNGSNNRPGLARSRRETINQSIPRGQKNHAVVPVFFEPPPAVVTDSYILKKYAGNPPSLVVHLHPTHFRFDLQDGTFSYKSPMKMFLDHVRSRTIPHDLLVHLNDAGVPFYDGCLIVQIHDHKSAVAQSKNVVRPKSKSNSDTPSSIHNYTPYVTPSSWVPHPKENMNTAEDGRLSIEGKATNGVSNDKENMPAPSAASGGQKSNIPPKAKVCTVVLHPTAQSLQMDLMIRVSTPRGSGGADSAMNPPPTPMSAVPPTPTAASMPPPAKKQKRESMELEASNVYDAESQILLATTAPLHLEVTKTTEETIALLTRMSDPKHSDPPPKPKTRKRTVAEREADKALATGQEKFMLTGDERLSSSVNGAQGATDVGDGNGQSGAAGFEARFEKFNVLAEIQREHDEKKEQEKLRNADNERKLAQQRQVQHQQQQEQQALLQHQQAEAEKQRREQQQEAQRQAHMRRAQAQEAQRVAHAHAQQQQQQQQQHAQAQAAQAQAKAAAAQSPPQMNQMPQPQHGHPPQNGPMANGLPNGAAHRFPPGVSQPPVSSPVVRQNTPHNMSSPMVGHVPMSQTNSGMGGSPPRPSSVVQNHAPMSAPMAVSMSARGSQQSHPSGTPRMPSATPQMSHGTPVSRPMATPRMSQASPPPAMMAQNSQMGQAMLMGSQNMGQHNPTPQMMAAHLAAQQQRQRIAQQQQHLAAMHSNGMQNPQMHNQMMQQQLLQQQFINMQNPNSGMSAAQRQQIHQRYQQSLGNMQHQHQMQGQMPGQQHMGNPNFANGSHANHAQMLQMQQHLQMQQQMRQQQMQQRGQQQQQQGANANMVEAQIRVRQQQIFHTNLANFLQTGGYDSVGSVPLEPLERFKQNCLQTARGIMHKEFMLQRQMAQQAQQQNAMNMGGGMPQGM